MGNKGSSGVIVRKLSLTPFSFHLRPPLPHSLQPEEKTFAVTILDANDNPAGKGELRVTKEDLELISPNRNIQWKLKFLRRFVADALCAFSPRFGYDKKYFSFEAGRRCGEDSKGIFAFSTPKVTCWHCHC